MESTYLSWSPPGVHLESIRSLPGVHQEYQAFIRTPDGVHQDAWGSVTYSQSTKRTSDIESANTSANSRTRDFTFCSWSSVRSVPNSIFDMISSIRSMLKGSRTRRDLLVPRLILKGSWCTSPSLCI